MSRREARILAVQALYAHDVGKIPLEELLNLEWNKPEEDFSLTQKNQQEDDNTKEPDEKLAATADEEQAFARILISGTIENLEQIDNLIKKHISKTWEFDRINKVALAILRISVYSLLFQKDITCSIIISEAIYIYKAFSDDDKYKFINAILDTISKETDA